jgi:hypothetical protein
MSEGVENLQHNACVAVEEPSKQRRVELGEVPLEGVGLRGWDRMHDRAVTDPVQHCARKSGAAIAWSGSDAATESRALVMRVFGVRNITRVLWRGLKSAQPIAVGMMFRPGQSNDIAL